MLQNLVVCDSCTLEVQRIWGSDVSDPNVLDAQFYLRSGANLWTMGGLALTNIVRFDILAGTSHLYDKRGEGPGEIAGGVAAATMHPSQDTLVIAQRLRIEYFTEDLEPVRSFRPTVRVRGAIVIVADGTVILSNARSIANISGANRALHTFSPDGVDLGSFRAIEDGYQGWLPLARGSEPLTIWVGVRESTGFVAEQWHVKTQELVRQVRFTADWWYVGGRVPNEDELRAGNVDADRLRPKSDVVGLHDDGRVLWVAAHHADPNFADEMAKPDPVYGSLYNAMLFAVDRDTGEVLGAESFIDGTYGFTTLGDFILFRVDRFGRPIINMMETRLLHGR